MKQIYKQIHVDEEGIYYYVTEDNTIQINDVQTSCLVHIIELLSNTLINKGEEQEDEPAELSD